MFYIETFSWWQFLATDKPSPRCKSYLYRWKKRLCKSIHIDNKQMHIQRSKRRNVGTAKPIMQRKLKKSSRKPKLYWIFDCRSTSSGLLPFCIRQHIFISVEIKFLIISPHKIKTHKKDSLGEKFLHFHITPTTSALPYTPSRSLLLLINIVFSLEILFIQ